MTDDLKRLKEALARQTPQPSDEGRARAMAAARQAFDRVHQGSTQTARPTHDQPQNAGGIMKGLTAMFKKLTTPQMLAATTAVATIAIGLAITTDIPGALQGSRTIVSEQDARARSELPVQPVTPQPAPPIANAPEALQSALDDSATRSDRSQNEAAVAKTGGDTSAVVGGEIASADALAKADGNVGNLVFEAPVEQEVMAERAPSPARSIAPAAGLVVADEPQIQMPVTTEEFGFAPANPIKSVSAEPVSTFSIDVDTASYSYVRSALMGGYLPDAEAVRVEELINYFDYAYPRPDIDEAPFSTSVSVTATPWNQHTKLMQIGIQGYDLPADSRPPVNLVFLIDTSGSMNEPNKLPLLIQSFRLLVNALRAEDSVAIVTYAGSAGMALEPTPASERGKILTSLENLRAGGSTAGQAGLQQAYALAEDMSEDGEVSRVILATDGDFNVGISDPDALKTFIEGKRDKGTYLSVLGFGRGNYQDDTMQALAQNGNGVAAYIDTLAEAQKVLVEQASGALFPIANDVKIQIEFNPALIAEYRLIGYETRGLNREDFNNDRVDAGEIGSGHTVTAIYEITPVGSPAVRINDLRYAPAADAPPASDEYAFLRLRYKRPGETTSQLIETPILPDRADIAPAEANFAAAVAGFGELLKGGLEQGDWSYKDALALASSARGEDPFGYRAEFLNLVRLASGIAGN